MVLSSFGPFPSGVFFTGAATAASDVVPAAYPVAIAGHPYNIEPRLYRRSNIPLQRQADTEDREPGEATLSPAGLWRRSQSDWSLGAGQVWLDEEESTRRRFLSSLGIDVFNDRRIGLLPDPTGRSLIGRSYRGQFKTARQYINLIYLFICRRVPSAPTKLQLWCAPWALQSFDPSAAV